MTIKLSNELGINLLNMLGIDPKRVSEVTISLKAGEVPTIEVVRILDEVESKQFLLDLKRYELTVREVENG